MKEAIPQESQAPKTSKQKESAEGAKELLELLSYEHPKADEYETLIRLARENNRYDDPTDFKSTWVSVIRTENHGVQKIQGTLRESLRHKTLIDLGSGVITRGYYDFLDFVRAVECREYIMVDPAFQWYRDITEAEKKLDVVPRNLFPKNAKKDRAFRKVDVAADMLGFISRIPTSHPDINFMLNGIDEDISPILRYNQSMVEELLRVTPSGGLIFGCNSEVLRIIEDDAKKQFIRIQEEKTGYRYGGLYVFKKI